jgi:ribosomal protein S18 acetylase RimI-like enzyme
MPDQPESEAIPVALQVPRCDHHLRPVLKHDIPTLCADVWASYDPAYAEKLIDRIQKYAIDGRGLGIVVEQRTDDTHHPLHPPLIAYGQMMMWTQCVEISDLIVSEGWRSHGIGTAMIQYLIRRARNMHITCAEIGVADSNHRALDLYRRLGFQHYRSLMLNVGQGVEPVTYLRLPLPAP